MNRKRIKTRLKRLGELKDIPFDVREKFGQDTEYMVRGDEGFLFRVKEGDETSVAKLWYANYIQNYDIEGKRGYRPRFHFSSYKEGFHRLFHLNRIAHDLFPKNYVNVTDIHIPHKLPFFYDLVHYPTDVEGKPDYPIFKMEEVEYPDDFLKRRKDRNDSIKDIERDLQIQFEGKMLSATPLLAMTTVRDFAVRDYDEVVTAELGNVNKEVKNIGFPNAGLEISHPEVNCCKTKKGEILFFEIESDVILPRLEKAIEDIPDAKTKEKTRIHLKEAIKYTIEAAEKAEKDNKYRWEDQGTGFIDEKGKNIPLEELKKKVVQG